MTEVSVSVQIEAVTLGEAWIAIATAILNDGCRGEPCPPEELAQGGRVHSNLAIRLLSGCYHTSATDAEVERFEFGFGSGPGIRTLNLAVNRSLHPVQKW